MPQFTGIWSLTEAQGAVRNQNWPGIAPPGVEYLVVAGGGGGGAGGSQGGGGGAGGLLAGFSGITIGSGITVTIGAGGAGATCNVKLTHSDTSGGAYTDVTGATFTEVGNTASVQKLSVNKNEMKRFVKAVCTVAGTASYKIGVELIGEYQYVS